jgi:hypothetical protein
VGQRGEAGQRVLVRVLGADRLAAREADRNAANVRHLLDLRDEVHLDAARAGRPHGPVCEAGEIEVSAELAVHPREEVLVEGRGHAGRVVVCALEHARVLAQVDADEEPAARPDEPRHAGHQRDRFRRLEVPDRRAGEVDGAAARSAARPRQPHRGGEVRAEREHLERGVVDAQRERSLVQVLARDVDRHVRRGPLEAVEQQPRLRAAAAAVFDEQGACADARCHLARVRTQDRELGARRVVLGEGADLLEQLRALRVVEVLARQRLRPAAEARERVLEEALALGVDVGAAPAQKRSHSTSSVSSARTPTVLCPASWPAHSPGLKTSAPPRRSCTARWVWPCSTTSCSAS